MEQKRSIIKHFGFGVAIAGAVSVFILTTIVSMDAFNPFIYHIWVAFIPLMIYYAKGVHKAFKVMGVMFLSFLVGLGWGWLSNLIAMQFGNGFAGHVLDHLILLFLMIWAHLTLLQRTPFNDLSMAFLGYATTIGFFGRPYPFAGFGFVGPLPPAMIVLLQIGYVVFGLLVVIMIECIGDVINGRLLRPKMPPKQ